MSTLGSASPGPTAARFRDQWVLTNRLLRLFIFFNHTINFLETEHYLFNFATTKLIDTDSITFHRPPQAQTSPV